MTSVFRKNLSYCYFCPFIDNTCIIIVSDGHYQWKYVQLAETVFYVACGILNIVMKQWLNLSGQMFDIQKLINSLHAKGGMNTN